MRTESAVKNEELAWQTRVLAASLSSGAIATIVQPLEVVKTMVQRPNHKQRIRTPLTAMRQVVKRNGIRALWKGLSPSLWRCVPGVTLYFHILSEMQKLEAVKKLKQTNPISSDFITAGGARAVCTIVLLPLTVVKTRSEALAATNAKSRGTLTALKMIARGEGIRSLFAGLSPSLVRDVPSAGLFFVTYEMGRSFLFNMIAEEEKQKRQKKGQTNTKKGEEKEGEEEMKAFYRFAVPLLAGVVAGSTSTLLTQPPDVIRARQQLTGRTDTLRVTKEIYQENGVKGFLAGCTPRLLRRSVTTAFTWAAFESIISVAEYLLGRR